MPAIVAVADTVLNDPDQALTNAALLNNYNAGIHRKSSITAKADTISLSAAEVLSGHIRGVPTAAANYTLPTAAAMVAAITGAIVGDTFDFIISNKSGGANTITVLAGGATLEGTATVAQNVARAFRAVLTNVTASSEAYTVVGLAA
jgi:hypothetical protein